MFNFKVVTTFVENDNVVSVTTRDWYKTEEECEDYIFKYCEDNGLFYQYRTEAGEFDFEKCTHRAFVDEKDSWKGSYLFDIIEFEKLEDDTEFDHYSPNEEYVQEEVYERKVDNNFIVDDEDEEEYNNSDEESKFSRRPSSPPQHNFVQKPRMIQNREPRQFNPRYRQQRNFNQEPRQFNHPNNPRQFNHPQQFNRNQHFKKNGPKQFNNSYYINPTFEQVPVQQEFENRNFAPKQFGMKKFNNNHNQQQQFIGNKRKFEQSGSPPQQFFGKKRRFDQSSSPPHPPPVKHFQKKNNSAIYTYVENNQNDLFPFWIRA